MKTNENQEQQDIQEIKQELIPETQANSNGSTVPTTGKLPESITTPVFNEETSKNHSEPGEEVIIYTEGFENSPEVIKLRKFFNSFLIFSFCFYSTLFLVSVACISVFVRQIPDFSFMFLAMVYYYVFQLPSLILKLHKQILVRQKLFRNIINLLHNLSFISTFLVIYLYLLSLTSGAVMFYVSIVNVLVQIIRYTCA